MPIYRDHVGPVAETVKEPICQLLNLLCPSQLLRPRGYARIWQDSHTTIMFTPLGLFLGYPKGLKTTEDYLEAVSDLGPV